LFDGDTLRRQVADGEARHEEDAKFFLEGEDLMNEVVAIYAWVLNQGEG